MRIVAYSQLLDSYRSVRLDSMAKDFGVSVEFLDKYSLPPPPPKPLLKYRETNITPLPTQGAGTIRCRGTLTLQDR